MGALSLQSRLSGRQFDDAANTYLLHGYFRLDAYASHDFGKRIQLFAVGENLLQPPDRSLQNPHNHPGHAPRRQGWASHPLGRRWNVTPASGAIELMNEEIRIKRARTFDKVAELYDRARRPCRDEFFDDLFALADMAPAGLEVLEIGCGTGQATLPLARRGCRVTCVEMGENMARIARSKFEPFPDVRVVNACFEEWRPDRAFDMVLAVQAWHWIEPQLRYVRAVEALRAGGILAFSSWNHAFPPGYDPFFAEIHAGYETIGDHSLQWPPAPPEEVPDERLELAQSSFFEDVQVLRRVWAEEFTAEEYVALMSTASDHRLMEQAKREWLFGEMRRLIAAHPGGRIIRHSLTILHVGRKKGA